MRIGSQDKEATFARVETGNPLQTVRENRKIESGLFVWGENLVENAEEELGLEKMFYVKTDSLIRISTFV